MWPPFSARFSSAIVCAACPLADRERADAAFERGHALLEHVLGRVHDPRVDDAELFEPEQRGRVLGVAEHERRRLVDRDGPGAGRRVGFCAGVDLTGLETPVGHVGSPASCGHVMWRRRYDNIPD